MEDSRACRNCGSVAEADDVFCGECGHKLGPPAAAGSVPDHPGEDDPAVTAGERSIWERGWLNRFGREWSLTICALFAFAVLLVILAWLRMSGALEVAVHVGLVALLILTPISTLALSWLRPIFPGWAASLLAVVYVIPVVFLAPDAIGSNLEGASPTFLVVGIVNIGLAALVCYLRRRRLRRRA